MHLNQLYGYFGRKLDLIETINVFNNDLILYVGSRIIKTIIQINDNISTILLHSNINPELIKELNSKFEFKLSSKFKM
jgi:phosphopantetheine adenylyltransferase